MNINGIETSWQDIFNSRFPQKDLEKEFDKKMREAAENHVKKDRYIPEQTAAGKIYCELYNKTGKKINHEDSEEIKEEPQSEKNGSKTNGADKEDSETDSNIVVNADGSRVLVITMHVGDMEATTSIQISKPTELQNSEESYSAENTEQLSQNLDIANSSGQEI